MAELSTFIKLDRNILDWSWYKDGNTMRVFIHLLLSANVSEGKFQNITVRRGQHITSRAVLSSELGLTEMQIRTALKHLVDTEEISIKSFGRRFTLITINNYSKYQNKAKPAAPPVEKPKGSGYVAKEVSKQKAEKLDKFTDAEGYEYTLIDGEYQITKRPAK